MNLDYYAQHGAALFPLPAGSKAPGSAAFWPSPDDATRAGSFLHHFSRDPLVWEEWNNQHPGCNFGVVGYASNWIIVDIDAKTPTSTPTPEEKATAQAEAWQAWADLCTAWGFAEPFAPHVMSARGGWHCYFTIPEEIDPATLRQPDAVAKRINVRVRGYTVAAGSFYDGSTATPPEESGSYQLYSETFAPYSAPGALLEHCAPAKPRENVAKIGTHDFDDVAKLYSWMAENGVIQTDEEWRNAGMAAKLEFGDNGFALWSIIAETLWNEPIDAQNEVRWRSFGTEATTNAVTMDSIFALAHRCGWKGTVRPSAESMFGGLGQLTPSIAPGAAPAPAPMPVYDFPLPDDGSSEAETSWPTPAGGFLKSSADFIGGFQAPDYLIDGILQRRFCYSLTAQTGVGKTTIAMRIAAHVDTKEKLGGIDVEQGDVIYFAGENPTDVQMRWLGLCREMGIDPATSRVHFISGTMPLSQVVQRINSEVTAKNLSPVLVIVDTAAAYFEGDNDNDNVQAGAHARTIRGLCNMPGAPCVLVLCHPTKGAKTIDEMTPRGGGAFLNEVDGNIGLVRNEAGVLVASAIGKFRGPEFPALNFGLKVIKDHPLLVDTKGRQIPTIVAEPISSGEVQRREELANKDDQKVLEALCNGTMQRNADLCKALGGWHHNKVGKALERLAKEGLALETKDYWSATPKGQKFINGMATAQPAGSYTPPPLMPLGQIPIPPMRSAPPMPPG